MWWYKYLVADGVDNNEMTCINRDKTMTDEQQNSDRKSN